MKETLSRAICLKSHGFLKTDSRESELMSDREAHCMPLIHKEINKLLMGSNWATALK